MLCAPPATISTSAPGVRSRWGATVRQPSTTLSQTLAACSGSTPAGSGTSIASANGTRSRSLSAPPQSAADDGAEPVHRPLGHRGQLPVRPARQRAHSPQLIWNGTTTRSPGRDVDYVLAHLDDLGDRLVAERDRAGNGRLAADRRLIEVAEGDGDRPHERLTGPLIRGAGTSSHSTSRFSVRVSCCMAGSSRLVALKLVRLYLVRSTLASTLVLVNAQCPLLPDIAWSRPPRACSSATATTAPPGVGWWTRRAHPGARSTTTSPAARRNWASRRSSSAPRRSPA